MKIIVNKTGVKRKFITDLKKFLFQLFPSISKNLEIIFVSDTTMRRYNKKFAGKSSTTDVLSFNVEETPIVIISVDTAKKNAIFYGEHFEDEMVRYIVHGILHLVGFDHKIESKSSLMKNKEDEIIGRWKKFRYS